jgi:F0F1-type ATP synthase membrane subunit b/b'
MKRILSLFVLATFIGTQFNYKAQASCQKDYILENEIATGMNRWMDENFNEFSYMFYVGGALMVFNPLAALVMYVTPVTTYYTIKAVDGIKDNRRNKIIRLLNYADYLSERLNFPDLHTNYVEFIPVSANSRKEARLDRKINRQNKRHNRNLVKLNAEIRSEISKSEKQFIKLYNNLAKNNPGLTTDQVARVISNANQDRVFCNGKLLQMKEIRTYLKDYLNQ